MVSRNDGANQVLLQVQEQLRSATLRHHDAGTLAFQLLVWAQLSGSGRLDGDETVTVALPKGASGIHDALDRLAEHDGVLGLAFTNASRYAAQAGDRIFSALNLATQLADGGVFERFTAVEIASELLTAAPDVLGAPPELAQLMVNLSIGPDQTSVYCPWESSGQIIGSLLESETYLQVRAESPSLSPLPALLSLFRKAPTDLVLSDPLRAPTAVKGGRLQKFDAALSIPPMGVGDDLKDVVEHDLYGRFPVKPATATGLMVQHILSQTEGTSAIVVPNGFLFGLGRDQELRAHLLNHGWVEAVIALPAGIFESTSVGAALLILNNETDHRHVAFVDATQPFFCEPAGKGKVTLHNTDAIYKFFNEFVWLDDAGEVGRPLDESLASVVPVEDILDNNASLDVSRYVMAQEQRDVQAQLASMPNKALADLAIIMSPVPNKDRKADSPAAIEVYEVGAADLPAAGYIQSPEKTISIQLTGRRSGNVDDVFLRPHDLVLIIKGSTGKVGIVPPDVPPPGVGGWIAGQSAVVLRGSGPDADLRGLGLWLRSKMGQQLLESIKTGASIPMISVGTLRKLRVLAPTARWTAAAVAALDKEADLQRRIAALQTEQSRIADELWNELYRADNS